MSNKTGSAFNWIIDPGHGGISGGVYQTSGKRSKVWSDGSQYFEGEGNRQIATYLEKLLIEGYIDYDFTVVPTDPRDMSLGSRVRRANKIHAKRKSILVSIHSNGFSKESANGYEVFTSPGQTGSDPIATIMIEKFGEAFPELNRRSDTSDGDLDKEAKFTMVAGTNCWAILIETMFHTNEKECRILMSEEGKQRIAKAIYAMILKVEYLAEQGKL